MSSAVGTSRRSSYRAAITRGSQRSGRTAAISGSRPYAIHTARFYRESVCIALFCLLRTPNDRLLGKIWQQIKGCNETCMIERLLVFHDTGDLKAHDCGKKPFCFLRAMP
jgi:hypothetical protein